MIPDTADGSYRGNVEELLLLNTNQRITSETAKCQWKGESMDYRLAIERLLALQRPTAAV